MLTRLAIVTEPALFVLLWSTGFIGARYGMPYIEPLTFLAVRMVFVVVIMAAQSRSWAVRGGLMRMRSAIASLQARWCTDLASEACSPRSARAYPPAFRH
jgi:drug/metabolite transporter (DMT)-like permease